MKRISSLLAALLVFSGMGFADEITPVPVQDIPVQNIERQNVYGTFGLNVGVIPTFNASVGYQGEKVGVDLQSNLFLVMPLDVSTHVKFGRYTKKGNYYAGLGPFYSLFMGFGGEIIGGYRSIPKDGLGWYVEAFGRPISTGSTITRDFDDLHDLKLAATYVGAGYGGIRAGIAF